MQSISERGSRGLVDQAQNFQSRYFSGILGGLTLRIVEIRRNGDDCAVHGFPKKRFSPIFQFAQNERGNLWRRKDSVSEPHANHILAFRVNAKRKEL